MKKIKFFIKRILPKIIIDKFKLLLILIPGEVGSEFNGSIKKIFYFKKKKKSNICIFSHFDKEHMIDDYVLYYIKKLKDADFDIVFVSTSQKLSDKEIEKLKDICKDVIVKENIGYDFGAWKSGLEHLGNQLYSYDKLLLCNDSVYAPLYPLGQIFDKMQKYDFWGITDSYEISYHIQSYFMVFNKNVFSSKVFDNFWKNYKVYKKKKNIILKYEIGLTKIFAKKNFKYGSYCKASKAINITHYLWEELLVNHKCPIIKIELLRDNPLNINIKKWRDIISSLDYDLGLIANHLKRVKSCQAK